ncbi:ROK family transcriptional regulator [Actinomadura opuntiae]|uniref:ROK family transcriptional regulator n=1 Tax=Actinomadura sp. OS1-43 TaxID=604315 RepID=UPI00255B0607|nr:ROK family transcriptional regulator [Actinomadura sp. OS1-43]MDL4818500.1 ROK family transcriptional regulator [Actinomadura sp. OS1-43]
MRRRRSTVRDLRRDNRSVVLWSLYFDQPRTRQELSRATGLSPASISNVTRDLIEEGIVVEAGSQDSDGGRPRALLRVDPSYGHVIGVDVGETRIRVELFDLMMVERAKAEFPLNPRDHGTDVVVERILAGLDGVIAQAGISASEVVGVGIGVPGVVEQGTEVLVHAQTYGWDAVPLQQLLQSGTHLPLYIDNGAKTMGQAELWFGAGQRTQHAVIALIGSGLGASIISDGTTYRGYTSSAGEWGHTTVVVGGRRCRCGARGCLEAYVGAEAILDRYGHPLPGKDQEEQLGALLDAAPSSPAAAEVLNATARYLGAGIASLINLLNPERIILGGWAGLLLGDRMLPAIYDAAREHSLGHPFTQTSIELGQFGPDAVALGAATLPIEQVLNGTTAPLALEGRTEP